ncbi:MAG: tetratricopeptide repeat protein [Pirellulales bacterium]|nr:tetratricopeptide repeat protein [Pirellulales bacterium]
MNSTHQTIGLGLLTLFFAVAVSETRAQEHASVEQARKALAARQFKKAEAIASKVIEKDSKSVDAHVVRAMARDEQNKYQEAASDMTLALKLKPDQPGFHNMRGSMRFKAGDIKGSLADYDRAIKLDPSLNQRHWQRGIVCYYADKFADGAKQFAAYQTYDDNDVENVVWRFACMARDVGVDKARKQMLSVRHDRRIPMMKIYAMFRGEAKPEDVIKAAETDSAGDARLNYQRFYANYYVGLYLESIGKPDLARPYLLAAPKYKNDHYMWHVARVHAERLAKQVPDEKP